MGPILLNKLLLVMKNHEIVHKNIKGVKYKNESINVARSGLGPIWAHMGPQGPYGPIRAHMGPQGPVWAHMGPYPDRANCRSNEEYTLT